MLKAFYCIIVFLTQMNAKKNAFNLKFKSLKKKLKKSFLYFFLNFSYDFLNLINCK